MSNHKVKVAPVTRREFMRCGSLLAIAVSVSTFPSCDEPRSEASSDCLTTDDILGPFYKANAPFVEDIVPAGTSAPVLLIQGKVFSHCNALLPDAIVEIWNANVDGAYDMSEQFLFRGRNLTTTDGNYSFRTIIPGRYLNGSNYRPSHIHFRVSAPGHQTLVSQIYFKEDPFLSGDPWASAPKAKERILPITKDTTGTDIVIFDIHLKKED